MPRTQPVAQPNTLDSAIAQFKHWRTHRTQRGKVPTELMEQALSLVGRYPLSNITTSLGLDFADFKRLCIQRGVVPGTPTPQTPTFVEVQPLLPPSTGNLPSIQIELLRSDGAAMRIHCAESDTAMQSIAQFLHG